MHAASAGGTWQALVCGFGGFRVLHGGMSFNPWSPKPWEEFRLQWRRNAVRVAIRHTEATFYLDAPDGVTERVLVCGTPLELLAKEPVTIHFSREGAPVSTGDALGA